MHDVPIVETVQYVTNAVKQAGGSQEDVATAAGGAAASVKAAEGRSAAKVAVAVAIHPGEVVSAYTMAPEDVKQALQSSLRLAVDGGKGRAQCFDGGGDCSICSVCSVCSVYGICGKCDCVRARA